MINTSELIIEIDSLKKELKEVKEQNKKANGKAKIYSAFIKAQREFKKAIVNRENPFFKSKYMTLGNLIEIVREAFSNNGLGFTQRPTLIEKNNKIYMQLETIIFHESGESLEPHVIEFPISAQRLNEQAFGSSSTYIRRYVLQSLVGICAEEDDDGNCACEADNKQEVSKPQEQQIQKSQPKQRPYCYCFKCKKPLYDKERADKVKAEYGCFLCETHEKQAEEEVNGKKEEALQKKIVV